MANPVIHVLGRRAESVNVWLASTPLVLGRRTMHDDFRRQILREATGARPAPESLRFYLDAARIGWRFMLFYSGLFSVGAAYVGDRVGGERGFWIGFGIGMFFFTACLIGEVDLVWRLIVVRAAKRQFIAGGETLDGSTERLLRLAKLNNGILLVQACGGLAVALTLSLAR